MFKTRGYYEELSLQDNRFSNSAMMVISCGSVTTEKKSNAA